MKKIFLFLAVAMLCVNCSDDDDAVIEPSGSQEVPDDNQEENDDGQDEPEVVPDDPNVDPDINEDEDEEENTLVTIFATANPLTSSDASYSFEFKAGDRISVVYNGETYSYVTPENGTSAVFLPMEESLPLDASGSLTAWYNIPDGTISVSGEQTAEGLDAMPMYAYTSSATVNNRRINMDFEAPVSIIALTVEDKSGKSASSFVVEPINESGVTGSLTASEVLVTPATGTVEVVAGATTSNKITVDVGSLSLIYDPTVNIYVLSGTEVTGGFKVTINFTDGTSLEREVMSEESVKFDSSYIPVTLHIPSFNYVKVTSDRDDWSGEYLIVYDDNSYVFDASNAKYNTSDNQKKITILEGGVIERNETTQNYAFIFAPFTDEYGEGYSIYAPATGNYIYHSSSANGTQFSATAQIPHLVFYDSSNSCTTVQSVRQTEGDKPWELRYNTEWDDIGGFRFYRQTQKTIQLYRYDDE